jgi:DNA polymerase-3 subunit delta'
MAELPPEADAIDGVPLPREQDMLFGHEGAAATLKAAYRSGRMHHAWLLTGPRGIGKATLAFRFAKFALSNPDPSAVDGSGDLLEPIDDRIAGQVAAGAHPNILHLKRPLSDDGKRHMKVLTVDEVRRLGGFFGRSAAMAGPRIAIVDAADDMNPNAANALLKMLEEPPTGAIFFVLSHTPGRLLPTIRSRCRTLALLALDRGPLAEAVVATEGIAPDALDERFFELAEGSVRRGLELLRHDGLELDASLRALLADAEKPDRRALHALAETVSGRGGDERYALFVDFVRGWLAERVSAGDGRSSRSLAADAEAWSAVDRIVAVTDALNLDRKQAVLDIFGKLAEAART